jgi:radical SAM superfamily enzyme YgiQ (UPF0313 family)
MSDESPSQAVAGAVSPHDARHVSRHPGEKTRILLIDPTDPWITNNRVLKHHDQVMLPIGLMYLSAYLKQFWDDRLEIKIVSTIVDLSGPEDLVALFQSYRPDIVGVRCVIFYSEEVVRIVQAAREMLPEAVVVAGGPNVTFDNENLRANPHIDILVEGEGEETFRELVELFIHKGRDELLQSLPGIAGIMFRREGQLVRNTPRKPIDDLDQLPIPDYSAVDLDRYQTFLNYGYNRRRMGVLFTSRGCPFRCTYCHMAFGKAFRARSAKSVHDEIVYLHREYGIKDFSIIDDNFTVDRPRVREFIRLMLENGPKVNFYFPNGVRADSLDDELLEGLRAAGAIYITFSLETASPRLQKEIKKFANIEKLRRVVQRSCDLGIITNLCIMVGFPTETLEEARYTLEYFSQFDRLVLPYYFSVKYYPGTELYQTAPAQGIVIDEQSYRAPYHGYEFQETLHISHRDFERLNQWYLRKIYLNPQRLANAVSILEKHFTEEEIKDMFTLFFRRKINDIRKDVLQVGTLAVREQADARLGT